MAPVLSSRDVERLLNAPSPDVRAELADKVATSLAEPDLSPREIALAQDVLRILAQDVATTVRASVSRGLRNSLLLPRDVARKLADDIDVVALPLLAESLVLTDEDLVDLVSHGSALRQETIAARPGLTETVSDALITHGGEPAVTVLMGNHTARIAEHSMDHAIVRFAGSNQVTEAMVSRPVLPIGISERLVALVSQELQQRLVTMHALPSGIASEIIHRSREHAVIHLSVGSSEEELTAMVAQMQRGDRLSPTLILRAVCSGDIAFFEAAMAVKGNIPLANAQILIHDPSGRGLTALYRKAGMPDNLFEAISAAVELIDRTGFDGADRDIERFRARIISRVLTITESLDAADADYLINVLGDVLLPPPEHEQIQAASGAAT
jgi:uncharacterized protein (DUF2336 family)